MAINFKDIAQKETSLSPVMKGKEKRKCREVMAAFPDGITVTGFDFVDTKDKKTGEMVVKPIVEFAENPNVFFYATTVLAKVLKAWVTAYDGDCDIASHDLKASGGVKIRLRESTTRDGNPLIAVDVIS